MPDDASQFFDRSQRLDFAALRRAQEADPAGAEARTRQWAEENAESIASFKAFVRQHGTLAEQLGDW